MIERIVIVQAKGAQKSTKSEGIYQVNYHAYLVIRGDNCRIYTLSIEHAVG